MCVFASSFFQFFGQGRTRVRVWDAWRIDEIGRRIPPSCAATVSVHPLNAKRLAVRGVSKGSSHALCLAGSPME